ncbi:39S ribosomal protein L34, mitochondrial [Oenanthe melanoleuca]|uniref:39S ribosomal protein L34, mitochondrial n=1 Tax=Oenanthe melanoleuca TaxID=2939378 RepID=UPI0024C1D2D4|nr:39S ribosomal protein L34, mitochondrial [Oenanthe melanoleuca]
MAALSRVWERVGGRSFSLLRGFPFPPLPNALEPLPRSSTLIPVPAWNFQQIRGRTRGNEYQPNNWKRKKTHGWIKRIRTPGGIAVILRRMLKGRKSLSH